MVIMSCWCYHFQVFFFLVIREPSQVNGRQQQTCGTGPTGFRIGVSCGRVTISDITEICPLKAPETNAGLAGQEKETPKI